jgi:CubicO group peptidase (beta-lactamase class C family)
LAKQAYSWTANGAKDINKNIWILIILALSFPCHALDAKVKKELDNELASIAKEFAIPALALTIIASGKRVYAEGFGFQDEENSVPVTNTTRFRIASISKLFTAQAIMQLAQQNKLSLDDNISQYLPETIETKFTIRQLLTHSSGLQDKIMPVANDSKRSTHDYLKLVIASSDQRGPALQFNYSDTGFNLLGAIVSRISGLPFEDYVKLNIFDPANMSDSGYWDGKRGVAADVAPTYKGANIDYDQQRPHDVAFFASEGAVSNVDDLGKWAISTLGFQQDILDKDSYIQMVQPSIKTAWGNIYMGLGWQVYRDGERLVARHPGSIRGYKSLIVTYPDSMNAFVLLTNAKQTPRFKIEKKITARLREAGVWQ